MKIYQKRITPKDCRNNPERLFAFGDNMLGRGKAGQAIIRDEPNAVGIPTKWKPTMAEDAFFTDEILNDTTVMFSIYFAINRLQIHAANGGTVVIPSDGIGTGLAELPKRAPKLHLEITKKLDLVP